MAKINLVKEDDGTWRWGKESFVERLWNSTLGRKGGGRNEIYSQQYLKLLGIFDPIFEGAKNKCESEFTKTLLRFKGMQPAMWDPYQVMIKNGGAISDLFRSTNKQPIKTTLALVSYGLTLESSEPYEMLANLLSISSGDTYIVLTRFPPVNNRPLSPSAKINKLISIANAQGIHGFDNLKDEIGLDKDLRNGVFHSDYAMLQDRVIAGSKHYPYDELHRLINYAMAYNDAFRTIYQLHVLGYQTPKIMDVHPRLVGDPEEKLATMIRLGYGLIAIQSAWTNEQERAGKIRMRIARGFTKRELKLLKEDPSRLAYPRDRSVEWP